MALKLARPFIEMGSNGIGNRHFAEVLDQRRSRLKGFVDRGRDLFVGANRNVKTAIDDRRPERLVLNDHSPTADIQALALERAGVRDQNARSAQKLEHFTVRRARPHVNIAAAVRLSAQRGAQHARMCEEDRSEAPPYHFTKDALDQPAGFHVLGSVKRNQD